MEEQTPISNTPSPNQPFSRSRLKRNYLIGERIMLGIGIIGIILISIAIVQYLNQPSLESTEEYTKNAAELDQPTADSIPTPNSSTPSTSNNEDVVISETPDQQRLPEDAIIDKSAIDDENKDIHLETSSKEKKEIKEPNSQEQKKKDAENHSQKFFLIAGSFDNEENASSLIAELSAQGYHPISIGKMGNSYKVAISSHANKSEADAQKSKLLEKGIETWILTK